MIRRRRIHRKDEDFVDSHAVPVRLLGTNPGAIPYRLYCNLLPRADEPDDCRACDRMLTGDYVEFEPRFSKIHNLAPNIVSIIAGDVDSQSSICVEVFDAKPQTVRDAAEIYSAELSKHNRKQAERKILAPLGFTMRSFFDKQTHLTPEFVGEILDQIKKERANVNTIICGTDSKGAHIYTLDEYGAFL